MSNILKRNENIIGYCFKYEFILSTQNEMNEKTYLLARNVSPIPHESPTDSRLIL